MTAQGEGTVSGAEPTWRQGLTTAAARARLAEEGYNDLPSGDRRGAARIVADVLREPMFALLLVAGSAYLLLGDLTEAIVLSAFATLSVLITVVQESRSERVLAALRDQASPRAFVIRDGRRQRIPGREVVRGDTIVLLEGDRIPADAVLVSTNGLMVDESLLTGESAAVHKGVGMLPAVMARPGGEGTAFVYSGTLAVHGEGIAIVQATGPKSELGSVLNKDSRGREVVIQGFRIEEDLDEAASVLVERSGVEPDRTAAATRSARRSPCRRSARDQWRCPYASVRSALA